MCCDTPALAPEGLAAGVVAMRQAADQQDKLGQDEVDIPAREMLGDLLLLERQPTEALKEYRVALKESPNRLNGLLSAGDVAEQAWLPNEAHEFYKAAAQQTDFGKDSQRPELVHAVKIAETPATQGQGRSRGVLRGRESQMRRGDGATFTTE